MSFLKNRIAIPLLVGLILLPEFSAQAYQDPKTAPADTTNQAPQAVPADTTDEFWFGLLDIQVTKLRLQLNLKIDKQGKVTGELLSLDQTSTALPVNNVVRTKDKLQFNVPQLGVTYDGTIDASGELASGILVQQGKKSELEFRKTPEAVSLTHQSTWSGQFSAGPQLYDFQFRVFVDTFKTFSVKLDSFTEGLWNIPCQFEKQENKIVFRNLMTKGEFVGTVNAENTQIEGNWVQRGLSIPVTLNRVSLEDSREPKFNRPQTPNPPFPYQQKGFAIVTHEIDPKYETNVGIAGTMTIPESTGEAKTAFPTVILINGSGQHDRDFTVLGHKSFLVIADYLTRQGYVVLRFDDRGTGQSVGNSANASMINYANDAEAVYRWALKQPEVDAKRVVLLGHSEGAMIAGMIAMRQPEIAGIILLASSGTNGREAFLWQSAAVGKASGIPEDIISKQQQFLTEVFAEAKKTTLELPLVKELFDKYFGELTDQQKLDYGMTSMPEITFSLLRSPWMSFYLDYDPRTALAYLKCPILSIFGGKDLQSDPTTQTAAIRAAIEVAQNLDFEQEVVPGLNHMLQPSETGSPREYWSIQTTIDERVLDLISKWLNRRFK